MTEAGNASIDYSGGRVGDFREQREELTDQTRPGDAAEPFDTSWWAWRPTFHRPERLVA